ncbi:hypothetical protein QYE76_020117 [Lolium multiflorum]|uniref:Transposase-associated domain-containing protein n=1 Tax=Lolium multiflorum TaxID=4521 RepID=A0AAD8VRL0_LOLMU|nr:hypothetical protein QYE76_020117 [Lolium multiflorum]
MATMRGARGGEAVLELFCRRGVVPSNDDAELLRPPNRDFVAVAPDASFARILLVLAVGGRRRKNCRRLRTAKKKDLRAAQAALFLLLSILAIAVGHLKMSHPWMYGNRCAPAFREGVNSFLLVAEANKSKQGFMCCPCLKCKNEKDYSCSRDIKSHLLRFGFMSSYNVWTKHGEEGVMMEDGDEEEDNDDQYRSMFSECFDTAMDDNEEEGGEEQASDDPVDDDLRRAISDARRDCGTDKERLQFDKMLEDHHKLLYPGCEDGHRKLGSILELLKWKAEVGVTDSGFEKLMIILKKLFPRNNELPVSTYEAKKLVCPLGFVITRI